MRTKQHTLQPKEVETARALSPNGENNFVNAVHNATRGRSSATTTQVRILYLILKF